MCQKIMTSFFLVIAKYKIFKYTVLTAMLYSIIMHTLSQSTYPMHC